MTILGIAGVQMPVSAIADNIDMMERYVAHVRKRFPWVTVMVFSELCVFGSSPIHAQPMPGEAEQRLQAIAAKYRMWLIPGSMFEELDGRIYNTTPIISPDGVVVDRYRKMFPFYPYEQGISAGDRFVVFDIPEVGRIGLSICYDMWFPETTRTLAAMGAEVIIHPTMTDTIDREVELAMCRAAAAQNQVYFFDVNGVGDGGVGQSCVVDCSGYVVHQASVMPEIMAVQVDLGKVRREREQGLRGLGQVLKSFRERPVEFHVYDRTANVDGFLHTLGPLKKPGRNLNDGLNEEQEGDPMNKAMEISGPMG